VLCFRNAVYGTVLTVMGSEGSVSKSLPGRTGCKAGLAI
jgi:hypothetical protein